jgi:hypothetical protein
MTLAVAGCLTAEGKGQAGPAILLFDWSTGKLVRTFKLGAPHLRARSVSDGPGVPSLTLRALIDNLPCRGNQEISFSGPARRSRSSRRNCRTRTRWRCTPRGSGSSSRRPTPTATATAGCWARRTSSPPNRPATPAAWTSAPTCTAWAAPPTTC